jgi:glutamyl-tRNA reductase
MTQSTAYTSETNQRFASSPAPIDLVGINHKTAPLTLREPVALSDDMIHVGLETARKHTGAQEVMILSTCNRTELIFVGAEKNLDTVWIALCRHIDLNTLKKAIYHHQNEQAIVHLIEVGAGIDSMMLGETDILGQLKKAFRLAQETATTGPLLRRLMPKLLESIKIIRQPMNSLPKPRSVVDGAYLVLANELRDELKNKHAVLVGTGAMAFCMAERLHKKVGTLHVVYRSKLKADRFVSQFGATIHPMDQLSEAILPADIIMTATNSPIPLLNDTTYPQQKKDISPEKKMLIDLSMPRDIHPELAQRPGVALYNLDDLAPEAKILSATLNVLDHKVNIQTQAESITAWLEAESALRHIGAFRRHAEAIAEQMLETGLKKLEQGDDPKALYQKMIHQITQKILHIPTVQLRKAALNQRTDILKASAFLVRDLKED